MLKLPNILLIEDNTDDYELIRRELSMSSLLNKCLCIQTEEELISELNTKNWDIIISDNALPRLNGTRALNIVKESDENTPFILVSGSIGEEAAVDIVLNGASDYISKDNLKRLVPSVKRAWREVLLREEQYSNNKKLVISELRFKNLTESINDAFFALDEDLKVTFWNDKASKTFGESFHIGSLISEVFPEWIDGEPIKQIRKSIKQQIPISINIKIERESVEYYEASISPSLSGVSIMLRKVTGKYLDRERLENLNNELETLLYRIGHDLKGPVASVHGLLNVAKIDQQLEKEELIKLMETRVDNLQDTLKTLLNIAEIRAGEAKPEKINLLKLIEQITESLKHYKAGVDVNYKIEIDPNLIILNDYSLLWCIWQNLIENALKYSVEDDKKVLIKIGGFPVGDKIEMQITDNGPGISTKIHSQIFEMFFRGDIRSEGSGLGLYMVKNALSKINGSIELDRTYDQGTRMRIVLPQQFENTRVVN